MPTLCWKDNRLPADDVAPWDTTVMFVGPSTPIRELIAGTMEWGDANSGSKYLMIYCHGAPAYLEICREGVQYKDLGLMKNLSPYFDGVSIHACSVAKGDAGKAFCIKMAQNMVAPVEAAVSLQTNTGLQTLYGWIDDGKYDGDYYIHTASGKRSGPIRSDSNPIVHASTY